MVHPLGNPAPLTLRLRHILSTLPQKWLLLMFGLFIQATYDFTSQFLILQPTLQIQKKISSTELSIMDLILDLFASFSILIAFLFVAIIKERNFANQTILARYGMKIVFVSAAVLAWISYMAIWLDMTQRVTSNKYVYFLYIVLLAHSTSMITLSNIVLTFFNFPKHRGATISLLQGFFVLGRFVFEELSNVFFDGHIGAFVVLLGFSPLIPSIIALLFVNFDIGHAEGVDSSINISYFWSAMILSAIVFVISILENIYHFKKSHKWAIHLLDWVYVFLMMFPILLHLLRRVMDHPQTVTDNQARRTAARALADAENEAATTEAAGENLGHIDGWVQVIRTLRFWAFLASCALTMAAKESLLDKNIFRFAVKLNMSNTKAENILSIAASSSFAVCMFVGQISDVILSRLGFGRPWLMAIGAFFMVFGQILGLTGHFFVGVVIMAAGYGSQLALMPTIAGEIFGVKNLGNVLSCVHLVSVFFNRLLLPKFNVINEHQVEGAFVVYLVLSVVGFAGSIILGWLTQDLYAPMMQAEADDDAGQEMH